MTKEKDGLIKEKNESYSIAEMTEWFWNSLNEHQKGFVSLTQNHRKNMPSDKDWKQLTQHQQRVIIKHLWSNICKTKLKDRETI